MAGGPPPAARLGQHHRAGPRRPGLPGHRRAAPRADRGPASDLRLEITEHTVISDAAGAGATLAAIRALGVGISLDDFGTGHSSLTRLRDLPVDELKLDRGFLRSTVAVADLAVIRAAVSLGRDLGLTVVAEGIEDARQWQELAAMGCDLAQGFFVAPALRPTEIGRWLTDWRPRA